MMIAVVRHTILRNIKCPYFISETTNGYSTDIKFQTKPYRLHRLDKGPASETFLRKEDALKYFEWMTYIRKMETNLANLYKAKAVRGFCHLYSGQEAVAAGIYATLRSNDAVITSYRCHSWVYLFTKKDPVFTVTAELLGRQGGCSRGKGGSMHLYAPNFYGGNGIVGAQVPLGVGIGLSFKYSNKDAVAVVLYGDGAANNGQVSEAFNMAKLYNLPCIFVCENNQYAMGTNVSRSSANTDFYTRGDQIPGIWVDGMDVLSVREATRFAIDYCISGKGPILLETYTYRYYGHSMSDPGTSYRTHDEVQKVRQTNDPVKNFRQLIVTANIVKEDELNQIDAKAKNDVADATKRAQADKDVNLEELTYDIYANELIQEVRYITPFKTMKHKTNKLSPNLK